MDFFFSPFKFIAKFTAFTSSMMKKFVVHCSSSPVVTLHAAATMPASTVAPVLPSMMGAAAASSLTTTTTNAFFPMSSVEYTAALQAVSWMIYQNTTHTPFIQMGFRLLVEPLLVIRHDTKPLRIHHHMKPLLIRHQAKPLYIDDDIDDLSGLEFVDEGSAVAIQAWWRRFSAESEYQRHRCAANILQRWIKCCNEAVALAKTVDDIAELFGRLSINDYHDDSRAIAIQSQWRRFSAESEYRRYRCAAIVLQRWIKHCNETVALAKSVDDITELFGRLSINDYHDDSRAIAIQSQWRRFSAESKYRRYRCAAIVLQRWIKHCIKAAALAKSVDDITELFGRLSINDYHEENSAVAIQSQWRRFSAESEYQRYRCAAIVLQRWIKRCIKAAALAKSVGNIAELFGRLAISRPFGERHRSQSDPSCGQKRLRRRTRPLAISLGKRHHGHSDPSCGLKRLRVE